ncbi:MAG TPA: hypothetical protein VIE66_16000, partial [Methylocella sp.]
IEITIRSVSITRPTLARYDSRISAPVGNPARPGDAGRSWPWSPQVDYANAILATRLVVVDSLSMLQLHKVS